jgi:hypothetical protein
MQQCPPVYTTKLNPTNFPKNHFEQLTLGLPIPQSATMKFAVLFSVLAPSLAFAASIGGKGGEDNSGALEQREVNSTIRCSYFRAI